MHRDQSWIDAASGIFLTTRLCQHIQEGMFFEDGLQDFLAIGEKVESFRDFRFAVDNGDKKFHVAQEFFFFFR